MAEGMSEREQLLELEALVRDNQLDRAVELGKELSDAYPDSFPVQFTYAGVLRRLDELDRAREILLELQRRYPENINLLLSLAEIARARRDPDAAREHYNRILFLDPFNPAARQALAALGGVPATPSAPPAPHRDVTPRRVEVNPEQDEPGADFEINLDDVRPDETPTLDLDEAGIPKPEVEDTVPSVPEFGMPLDALTDASPAPFPDPKPVAPEPEANEPEPERPEAVLRVSHDEFFPAPEPDLTDTAPLRLDTFEEEKVDQKREADQDGVDRGGENVEFFTESAANLYAAQGLWSEAEEIFRELHRRDGTERYLESARRMRRRRLNQAKIERLRNLLNDIKSSRHGEPDV